MMTPEAQAALLENFRASLPIILDGTEERNWPFTLSHEKHADDWDCGPTEENTRRFFIYRSVVEASGQSAIEILGRKRRHPLPEVRLVLYRVLRLHCPEMSIKEIGAFVHKDGSTVYSGLAAYNGRCQRSDYMRNLIVRVTGIIGGW